MFESLLSWTCYIHLIMIGNNKLCVGSKKQIGTIFSTWWIEIQSPSPYWDLVSLFFNSPNFESMKEITCVVCGPNFFGHSQATWPNFPQYKQKWFVCCCYFFCSMRGLNIVSSICMGSSFVVDRTSWGGMGVVKFLCTSDGSQRFFCWHSKKQLSQRTTFAIVWLKVVGSNMVKNKCFMSMYSLNWNWLVNATLSHEMSHVNCLNLKAYTNACRDPWWKDHNLLIDVHFLFEFPKVTMNFLRNASKLFKSDD